MFTEVGQRRVRYEVPVVASGVVRADQRDDQTEQEKSSQHHPGPQWVEPAALQNRRRSAPGRGGDHRWGRFEDERGRGSDGGRGRGRHGGRRCCDGGRRRPGLFRCGGRTGAGGPPLLPRHSVPPRGWFRRQWPGPRPPVRPDARVRRAQPRRRPGGHSSSDSDGSEVATGASTSTARADPAT